ncbi:MAG: DUF4445 domain-containing protein [Planctomycetales bacterium]|nr:DUF4445 domain-containing protein [Planctomycetales bacterium]
MAAFVDINAQVCEAAIGQTLFECAEQLGVRVPTSCFKNGKCRECLVEVAAGSGMLSPPSPSEAHLREGFRLACQAKIVSEARSIRCHTLRRGAMRIERQGTLAADTPGGIPHDPAVTRDGDWVLLDGQPLVQADGPLLGLAIDVGTTTVVVRLVDLETGRLRDARSFENPQRFAGSDIMARIHYDGEQQGRLLQRTLLAYLGHAIEEFDCDPQTIYEAVVVGNTTMRDLAFGIDVASVGQRPYRSVTQREMADGVRQTTAVEATARQLRLPICPQARVVSLPLVSGHVGADAAACLLAIGMADEDRTVALMDIGTNTELIVGNRGRLLAASCPAGPAFEGGAIACGMPGLEGAVESIRLSAVGIESLRTIGDGPPQGLCGSALVELLSELLRTGRIDRFGRFVNDEHQFMIDETHNIYLNEPDISELAQAKGANAAGLRIVLSRYGIDLGEIDRFYLAGGFARHINVSAARRIGLIPDLPDERIVQIGNAAIEGATRALCSASSRRRLDELVRQIEHVELETDPQFFDHFVDGCQLAPLQRLTPSS